MLLAASLGIAIQAKTLTVFAASSLQDSFKEIARAFERERPGVKVGLSFGGSQLLAAQIRQGAPADVFASASVKNLLESDPDEKSIRIFAHNRLVVVVRKSFDRVRTVKDLGLAERIAVADVKVPVGRYTKDFLDLAGKKYGSDWLARVQKRVVSRELDVRGVLTKVVIGEADAGVVYVSDAVSATGKVRRVEIPTALNQIAKYPAAVTSRPSQGALARDFVKYLTGPTSQKILVRSGFVSP